MSTPEKQALLNRLNQDALNAHSKAAERAQQLSKAPPPAPKMLEVEDLEFPKWVHKFEPSEHAPGHHKAKESKLAEDAEHLKTLLAKGFTEAAPKHESKKPAADAKKE